MSLSLRELKQGCQFFQYVQINLKKKINILLPSKTTISVTVLKIQHPIYKNGCQDEIFSHSNMTQKIEA